MIFALYRTKVQMSTLFLRDRPGNFAHVFNVPLLSLLRMFFRFFSLDMWDLLRLTYPEEIKNPSIWRKKKQSKKGRQGRSKPVCKVLGSI